MVKPTLQQEFELAMQHYEAGRLERAEAVCLQIIGHYPRHFGVLHFLGVIVAQQGRLDLAIDLIRQSIAINPNWADAHYNLGNALKGSGQMDEAIAAYRKTIILNSKFAEAYSNLGAALNDEGRIDEAIAAYRQAIAQQPQFPEAYFNLGNALVSKGWLDEAIAAYRQAIKIKPDDAKPLTNLGIALRDKGLLDEAVAVYRQAIALRPDYPEPHNNLGIVLRDKGLLDEAIASCRQAIALNPGYVDAYFNLGNVLQDKGQLDDAIAAFHTSLALKPDYSEAYNNIGNVLIDKGKLDDAINAYRQSITLKPSFAKAHSNLVFNLHYHPDYTAQLILNEARLWADRHESPLASEILPHLNDPSPDRRLRIGYVSPDFRDHAVGRNLLPLFKHHDQTNFDITCYAQVRRPDAMTGEFQKHANRWQNINGLSDLDVAKQIREDRIDLLIDLTLHTAENRLLVFARKPAPVQATFAGYPGTTGLRSIDYRLSDPYLDPPGADESAYSEKTIRLPDSFWCYDPLNDRDIPVNSLPALDSGFITFGCLNNFCKINESLLSLWSQVLQQVENSKLLLLAIPQSQGQWIISLLGRKGIDQSRIEFVSRQPRQEYLKLYHRIDIGLDSFPYNGHTTSLDSFWMGVPVVTRPGRTVVSRAGWSQLSNLRLTELAAESDDRFVQIAVNLSRDLQRLKELRLTLRQRMEQSPLMDALKFARGIESACRMMWRSWCDTQLPHR